MICEIQTVFPTTCKLYFCQECHSVMYGLEKPSVCQLCRVLKIVPKQFEARDDWCEEKKQETLESPTARALKNDMMHKAALDKAIAAGVKADQDLEWIDEAVENGFKRDAIAAPTVVAVRVLRNVQSAVKDAYLKRELAKREDKEP